MLRWFSLSLLLLLLAVPCRAQIAVTPICDLLVDDNGDCTVDTPPIDEQVAVEGVVLAWQEFGVRGPGAIYDPVSGCCISIFDIDLAPNLAAGTLVRVTGWMGTFAGLVEITDNPADATMDPLVEVLGAAPLPPMDYPETSQLADFSPWAEAHESCLMSICGSFQVTGDFGSGVNYDFLGVNGEICTVRVDNDTDLVGQPIPGGVVLVTGILGQFDGFSSSCVGYQLLPRSMADLTVGDCASIPAQEKSWGSIKSEFQSQ